MRKGILLACFVMLMIGSSVALANDPPHNDDSGVPCGECHGTILFKTDPSSMPLDDLKDAYNDMCLRCHKLYDDGSYHGNSGPKVDAHTSGVTQGVYDFKTSCVDCHHPHQQSPQFWYGRKYYKSAYELAYGTGTAAPDLDDPTRTIVTYDSLTLKSGWLVAQLAEKTSLGRGAMLLPNRNSPYNSRIIESISGDENGGTIRVKGSATISTTAGFAIAYGQAIKRDIPYLIDGVTPVTKQVEFLDKTGDRSFAVDESGTGTDTTPTGICQVCHTQTDHWRNDGTKSAEGVHSGMDNGVNCIACHAHSKGFEASCDVCHGFPPGALVSEPGPTGSITAGAHIEHTGNQGYGCEVCHYESVGSGPTHNNGVDLKITMGFSPPKNIPQGGSYDGQASAQYNATTTSPITSVNNSGSKNCTNLYCHSSAQGISDPTDPPDYKTPNWDGSALGCTGCHNAGNHPGGPDPPLMNSGSHNDHVQYFFTGGGNCQVCHFLDTGNICGQCHNPHSGLSERAAKHVDHSIDVDFHASFVGSDAAYTGDRLPGTAYGSCESTYCHGNYDGSGLDATPTWGEGASGDCGTCHGGGNSSPPASGTHVTHAHSSVFNYACTICHEALITGTGPANYSIADYNNHVDGMVDWKFDASNAMLQSGSGTYSIASGSAPPSDGVARAYGTCDNLYCHSNAQPDGGIGAPDNYATTPVWGDKNAISCSSCHKGGAHDAPPASSMSSGSHTKHLEYYKYPFPAAASCQVCHYLNTYPAKTECDSCHLKGLGLDTGENIRIEKHVDGAIDIDFMTSIVGETGSYSGDPVPGDGYGSCSNTYCHGNYDGSGLNATPTWGDAATADCGTCHGAANNAVLTSGSHERHAGDGTQAYIGYDMANMEFECTLCHEGIVEGAGPSAYTIADTSKHVSGKVDWKFDASDSRMAIGTPSYSIATDDQPPSDGTTPRAFGSCTVYCHSNVQPDGGVGAPDNYEALDDASPRKWGEVGGCYGCHTDYTTYQNKTDQGQSITRHKRIFSGSHITHINNTGVATNPMDCLRCHNWSGTASGWGSGCNWGLCHNTPGEKTLHADGKIDIVFGTSIEGTYNDPDTNLPGDGYSDCSNTYCHGDGKSLRTGTIVPNTSPAWGNSSSLPCNACHGNTNPSYSDNDCTNGLDRRSGMPEYSNRTSENDYTNKENSHIEHVIDNDIGCEYCHWYTTQDGCTINNVAYHNSIVTYRVSSATSNRQYAGRYLETIYYYKPDTLDISPDYGGYCSRVSCHGWSSDTSYVTENWNLIFWGQYQGCGNCHSRYANTGTVGEGDIDNYTYGNGIHAYIDRDQWEWSGHGKASGTYDVSGNPAADFTGAANCSAPLFERCDPCLYCHEDSVGHDKTNAGPNFFRLANYDALGNGWNDVCLVCHKTGTTGYDPDGAGGSMAKKAATVKIAGSTNSHWGAKHGVSNDGGSLCWDCHDPHGDRYQATGNIYMIQESVTKDKTDVIGKPASSGSPVFIANALEIDYVESSSPFNGICNVCHTVTDHYTSTSGDDHPTPDQKCSDCHDMHYGLDPELDTDGDTVKDINDNCPDDPNPFQENSDSDIWGDACDVCDFDSDNDIDGDGICGDVDSCPQDANDDSLDSDGVCACTLIPESFCAGVIDNCPNDFNPGQEDLDGDGIGDSCDPLCYGNPQTDWVENYGTTAGDFGKGITVDNGGNVYLTGRTYGAWEGSNQGTDDIFIAKYDINGANQWARQTGTSSWDSGNSIDVDTAGNVYVTGHTAGQLPGSDVGTYPEDTFAGNQDIFITKYNNSGTLQWVRQMGTTGQENSLSIAVDSGGNSYIAGDTPLTLPGANASSGSTDVFYAKYDANGAKLWVKQFGSATYDYSGYISLDPSGTYFYIAGTTSGTLPGSPDANAGVADIFVAKFDASTGNNIWVRQLGTTANDVSRGIAVDSSGNAYITGYTGAALPGSSDAYAGGLYDAFVAKYDSAGNKIWVKMIGTSLADTAWGISLNSDGSYVFVAGVTDGRTLFRQDNSRFNYDEIFFARYYTADPDDPDHPVLGKLLGTTLDEKATDIAVDAGGNSYVTGDTTVQLPGSSTSYGGSDTFIIKSLYCP